MIFNIFKRHLLINESARTVKVITFGDRSYVERVIDANKEIKDFGVTSAETKKIWLDWMLT